MRTIPPLINCIGTNLIRCKNFNFLSRHPILVKPLTDNRISETHWHDYFQVWYTISGEYSHTINGVQLPQTPGSAALIFPYTIHSIDSSASDLSQLSVVSMSIRPDFIDSDGIPFFALDFNRAAFDSFCMSPMSMLRGRTKAAADRIFCDIVDEYGKKNEMDSKRIMHLFINFLELCVAGRRRMFTRDSINSELERVSCINEATTYILQNSSDRLHLKSISRAAMMSERSLTEKFRATVGQTCHSYLNCVRISNAIQLMRFTRKSISEIAQECGYSNSGHFIRMCSEALGATPLTVRKQMAAWTLEYGDELFEKDVEDYGWLGFFDDEYTPTRRYNSMRQP